MNGDYRMVLVTCLFSIFRFNLNHFQYHHYDFRKVYPFRSWFSYVIMNFCYIRILFSFQCYTFSSISFVRGFQFETDKNLYRQFLLTSCEGVYKLWLSNGRSDCCRNYLLRLADFGVALSKLQPNGLGKVRIEPYSLL